MNIALSPLSHDIWREVAYHEAGHAVAKIVNGRVLFDEGYFDRVCIRPGAIGPHTDRRGRTSDILGCVEGPAFYNVLGLRASLEFPDESFRLHLRSCAIYEIIGCLAGPFAEMAFGEMRDPIDMALLAQDAYGWCSTDYDIAEQVFAELRYLTPRRPRWATLEDRTARLVLDNWSAIEALAEQLLVKHELDFDEALAIVSPLLPSTGEADAVSRLNDLAERGLSAVAGAGSAGRQRGERIQITTALFERGL